MDWRTFLLLLLGAAGCFWAWMAGSMINRGDYDIALLPALPFLGVIAVLLGVWRGKIK